jgi:DNA polymerase-4
VQFLRPLKVSAIPGVGKVTAEALAHAGIERIADLQDSTRDLRALVGSFGPVLRDLAFGIDDRPLDTSDEPKSISSETTFLHDTADRQQLRAALWEHAADISSKLAQHGLEAFTLQVKVRYGDFTTLTRQISVQDAVSERREIYRLSCYVLAKEKLVQRPLRLIGVGVSGLTEPSAQLRLPLEGKAV